MSRNTWHCLSAGPLSGLLSGAFGPAFGPTLGSAWGFLRPPWGFLRPPWFSGTASQRTSCCRSMAHAGFQASTDPYMSSDCASCAPVPVLTWVCASMPGCLAEWQNGVLLVWESGRQLHPLAWRFSDLPSTSAAATAARVLYFSAVSGVACLVHFQSPAVSSLTDRWVCYLVGWLVFQSICSKLPGCKYCR